MEKVNKVSVSLALILLLCFFLPWVQVSCGGAKDTASGLDLARDGEGGLWLIPLLAVVIIICGVRLLRINQTIFALLALFSGAVIVYLMNHERVKFHDTSGVIEARLTVGFWLGLLAAIAMAASGILGLLRRPRSP
jgi:hypothetical protein